MDWRVWIRPKATRSRSTLLFHKLTPEFAIFLTITDTTTGTVVYSNSSGVDTTTSFAVGAGTFTAGDSYIAGLDFTNRELITSPPCEGSDPSQCPDIGEIGFDSRTDVPSPRAPAPCLSLRNG